MKLLDKKGCDAVLFSLYGIVPRKNYDVRGKLRNLQNVKTVFLEEFDDAKERRKPGRFVVYHRASVEWKEYEFQQIFGKLAEMQKKGKMDAFVKTEIPTRIMGNCCVLLCGESNGVKYSTAKKKVATPLDCSTPFPRKHQSFLIRYTTA